MYNLLNKINLKPKAAWIKFCVLAIFSISALFAATLIILQAAVSLDIQDQDPFPEGAHHEAMAHRLQADIQALSAPGERVTRMAQLAAANYLETEVSRMGYHTWVQEYEYEGENYPNVIASRSPLSSDSHYIVLMAHFDSIGWGKPPRAPGADDDGSGLAVLLELARTFQEVDSPRPLVFCFFSNEEVGLRGSRAFVNWAEENNIPIEAAVNLDILGYNRPRKVIDLEAIIAQGWPTAKLGALRKQLANTLTGFRHGSQAILVAGLPEHASLVKEVSQNLAQNSGLTVISRAREDCG